MTTPRSRDRLPRVCTAPRTTLGVLLVAHCLTGCGTVAPSHGPYSADADRAREPERSRELTREAKSLWNSKPERAEALLRQALDADLFNGPAHNNLGVLLLQRGQLYDAANEFEWARKLLPGHPDPRVNLALTLEKAGKTESALDAYDSALAVHDGYLPALQGRTRLRVLSGRSAQVPADDFEQIALRGNERWREWAKLWASKLQSP